MDVAQTIVRARVPPLPFSYSEDLKKIIIMLLTKVSLILLSMILSHVVFQDPSSRPSIADCIAWCKTRGHWACQAPEETVPSAISSPISTVASRRDAANSMLASEPSSLWSCKDAPATSQGTVAQSTARQGASVIVNDYR